MSVTKLSKNKFLKVLLVVMVFVLSFQINVNKPKAFAPLVGIGIQVVGGLIVSEMVEMGIKAGSKAVVKKQADNFAKMALNEKNIYGLTFMRTNPYKNKDGSLVLNPSVNDRAKIAGLIAGSYAAYLLEMDTDGDGVPEACSPVPSGSKRIPFKPKGYYSDGSGDVSADNQFWHNFAQRNVTAYQVIGANPANPTGSTLYFKSNVNQKLLASMELSEFTTKTISHAFTDKSSSTSGANLGYFYNSGEYGMQNNYSGFAVTKDNVGGQYFATNEDVASSVGSTLTYCNDMAIPSTMKNVYQLPLETPDSFVMPNANDIPKTPFIIKNFFPPSDEEGPISWEEIANDYSEDDIATIIDSNLDDYTENGDINNNEYTTEVINNYYTDINYPIKVPDLKPPVEEIKPPVVTVPVEDVDDLDHSMWEVLRNTYNYLDDGIDSSLAAMKGITDSAKGITNYLASAMGWLPPEWRAVFTSAFVLGVFAHFLRR